MHPDTLETIKSANTLDEKIDGADQLNDTNEELEDNSFKFAIVSVDIDHYSFNPKSQFMIVKVIEEAVGKT